LLFTHTFITCTRLLPWFFVILLLLNLFASLVSTFGSSAFISKLYHDFKCLLKFSCYFSSVRRDSSLSKALQTSRRFPPNTFAGCSHPLKSFHSIFVYFPGFFPIFLAYLVGSLLSSLPSNLRIFIFIVCCWILVSLRFSKKNSASEFRDFSLQHPSLQDLSSLQQSPPSINSSFTNSAIANKQKSIAEDDRKVESFSRRSVAPNHVWSKSQPHRRPSRPPHQTTSPSSHQIPFYFILPVILCIYKGIFLVFFSPSIDVQVGQTGEESLN
jgi:hypothetical protein